MPNVVELLEMYGVLIVFGVVLLAQGGLPVPAFPILILSGASAVSGGVSWQACIGTAVLACLIGDYLWFSAGRFYGGRVLGLLCKISLSPDVCVSQTEEQFARFGAKSLLVAKFIPGFSIVASPISGALGVSATRFLGYSIAGSLLWSASGLALGAYFSHSVAGLLTVMNKMGSTALLGLLALLIAFVLYKFVERVRFRSGMEMERVSMAEFAHLVDDGQDPLVIDARSVTAQKLGEAIPGAVNLNAHDAPSFMAGLDKERHLIIYCNCPNDVTAARVASEFLANGFSRARPLKGGLDAWHDQSKATRVFA